MQLRNLFKPKMMNSRPANRQSTNRTLFFMMS
jgi:hypothetical protein